ncbi:MAG: hypothetical protein L0H63_13860 [Nitrococcus sp.]|nr:hypothetical protein [Nitrococcus sp.]
MNTTAQRVPIIRQRYRCRWLFYCTAVTVLVVAGSWAAKNCAEERLGQADATSSHAPAHFQAETLDDRVLDAINGKGGVDGLRPLINLSIVLWDEPGRGGTKRQALAENTPGDTIHGLLLKHQDALSIRRK